MVLIRKKQKTEILGFSNVYFTFEKLLPLQLKLNQFVALPLYIYISVSFLLLIVLAFLFLRDSFAGGGR